MLMIPASFNSFVLVFLSLFSLSDFDGVGRWKALRGLGRGPALLRASGGWLQTGRQPEAVEASSRRLCRRTDQQSVICNQSRERKRVEWWWYLIVVQALS